MAVAKLVVHRNEFVNGRAITSERAQRYRQCRKSIIAIIIAISLDVESFVANTAVSEIDGDVEFTVDTISVRGHKVENMALSLGFRYAEATTNQ